MGVVGQDMLYKREWWTLKRPMRIEAGKWDDQDPVGNALIVIILCLHVALVRGVHLIEQISRMIVS